MNTTKYLSFPLLFANLLTLSINGKSVIPLRASPERFSFYGQLESEPCKTIHIKDFGAIGDGVTNSTTAFRKASEYLQSNGGTLIIDKGTYIVGIQRFSGAHGAGSAYFADPVLDFKDAKRAITIIGDMAVLKAADGLKFGSFNPITGQKDSIRKEGDRSSYYASAYTLINAVGCLSITIKNLTLDGNSGKLNIGPAFGKEGIQLSATGIRLFNNKKVEITDCLIHDCALDAITIGWTGLTNTEPAYPHIIRKVIARNSGRQGLSWVGGNNLTVINSEFSSTGKALNNDKPVVSEPSAGIDIEIENSIIKNGSFTNCLMYDNAGSGVISIGQDTYNINFRNCTFIGTSNSAAYPKSKNFSFLNCTFVGKVERIFGSEDKNSAIHFKDCLFTMDAGKSPNGKVFGDTWEFYDAQNAIFDRCKFDAGNRKLPTFNTPEITFLNCSFSQNNDQDFNAAAIFKGTTEFIMKGKGKLNSGRSNFQGTIIFNHQKYADIKKISWQK